MYRGILLLVIGLLIGCAKPTPADGVFPLRQSLEGKGDVRSGEVESSGGGDQEGEYSINLVQEQISVEESTSGRNSKRGTEPEGRIGEPGVSAQLEGEEEKPKQKMVARPHLRITSPEMETRFLRLVELRDTSRADFEVLHRLLSEKEKDLRVLANGLEQRFGVEPGRDYECDWEENKLYLVEPSENEEEGAELQKRRVVLTFENEESKQVFLNIAAAKELVAEQIRVLAILINEKKGKREEFDTILREEFAISRDRSYHYAPGDQILYEILSLPSAKDSVGEVNSDQSSVTVKEGNAGQAAVLSDPGFNLDSSTEVNHAF